MSVCDEMILWSEVLVKVINNFINEVHIFVLHFN